MVKVNNNKKKSDIHKILESVIKKCVSDISKMLNQDKDEGLGFFDALDKVLELYNLEDEIIIKYEEELVKFGLKNKDLSLKPKQVDITKQKIREQLYKNYIDKFENKKH
ncbi:MAG: hypothetical protein ACFFHV_14560 [Promethearchaeota archaeon]